MMSFRLSFLLTIAVMGTCAKAAQIDHERARNYFDRFQEMCQAEAGRLWGESLCGPILFVDPETRMAVANHPDARGVLVREGEVYVGTYPSNLPIANFSAEWSGTRWTILVWTYLPEAEDQRLTLMAHEAYHRIQPALGVGLSAPANTHLDGFHGRYWLRLEMRALDRALSSEGPARRQSIEDALLFRAVRRAPEPQAAAEEASLERNEGLAQYTGVTVGAPAGGTMPAEMARRQLAGQQNSPSLVRSFAYGTGPAYGVLLDAYSLENWRARAFHGESLDNLLAEAAAIRVPGLASVASRASFYGAEEIGRLEQAREAERRTRLAEFRRRLVDEPVIVVPMRSGASFDPSRIYALGESGTVYGRYMLGADWGNLDVNEMALVPPGGASIVLPGPAEVNGGRVTGRGWTMNLAPGWSFQPGERAGDLELRRIRD
jgi:hypothetical protein